MRVRAAAVDILPKQAEAADVAAVGQVILLLVMGRGGDGVRAEVGVRLRRRVGILVAGRRVGMLKVGEEVVRGLCDGGGHGHGRGGLVGVHVLGIGIHACGVGGRWLLGRGLLLVVMLLLLLLLER